MKYFCGMGGACLAGGVGRGGVLGARLGLVRCQQEWTFWSAVFSVCTGVQTLVPLWDVILCGLGRGDSGLFSLIYSSLCMSLVSVILCLLDIKCQGFASLGGFIRAIQV